MAAGFKYDLVPPDEQEERYDVQTGIRRRGPFKLDTQNLVVGSFLPGFTPICADLKNKFAYAVINVRVVEESLYHWWRGFVYQSSQELFGLCGYVCRKRQERCRSNGN